MSTIRAILTDVEGTTTPISFVHEILFPYAAQRLELATARAATDPELAVAVERLRAEYDAEPEAARDGVAFGDGAPYARWLMTRDRSSTGLEMLQGLIWRAGYRDGTLRAQVFDDVPGALDAWRRRGLRLRVFSSGSALAQKLLFAHTERGDLTPFFEDYHDTTTGPMKSAASYRAIAAAYGLDPEAILFLSDLPSELDAAREAGLSTALLRRPGNPAVGEGVIHAAYRDFDALAPLLVN